MKKILILVTCVLFAASLRAESFSMRDCLLLPVSDTAGNSFGFKVYENLERYLKSNKWCNFKPSSDVLSILSKYRDKLPEYLKDEKVLQTVANRSKVGTMFRVEIVYGVDSLTVSLDVIGENGSDKYLSEKTVLNKVDEDLVVTTLRNWLETFRATIPYQGKVVGVLGDQITFTFSKDNKIDIAQDYKISRLLKKKQHPLLKKVVEWDTVAVGRGKVFNLSRGQALGVMKVYMSDKQVSVGDWVKLEKVPFKEKRGSERFSKYDENRYGKLGDLSLSFLLSSHTASTSASTGNNKMDGLIYGVSAEAEAWITRNYFVMGEFAKRIGSLDSSSGSPSSDTSGQNTGTLKVGGGYKYLPMGFFYGPQVNAYTGWAQYSYIMDESSEDGFGSNSFGGIILGLGGSIPLQKGLRLYGSGEVMPFPEFEDESNIFGSSKSISSMVFEIGAQYNWSSGLKIMGAFESISNSGKFKGSNSDVTYRDATIKLGGVFTF